METLRAVFGLCLSVRFHLRLVPLYAVFLAVLSAQSATRAEPQTQQIVASFWPAFLGFALLVAIAAISVVAIIRARRPAPTEMGDFWKTLAENMAEIVLVIEPSGKIVYVNRETAEYQSLIGARSETLLDPLEHNRWLSILYSSAHSAVRTDAILKARPPLQSPQFWEVRVSRIDEKEQSGNLLVCTRDVTVAHHRELTREILLNLTNASLSVAKLPELYETVRTELGKLVDTGNSYLALYDSRNDRYQLPMVHDCFMEEELKKGWQDFRGGLTDRVRRTGEALLVDDSNREQLVQAEGLRSIGHRAQCWLGIPLRNGHDVFGVFVVQSYDDPRAFTDADIDVIRIVADSVSLAILRTRTSTQLAQNEARLRLLTEKMPALVWSLDSAGVIAYVTGAALHDLQLSPEDMRGTRLEEHFLCSAGNEIGAAGATQGDSATVRLIRNHRTFDGFVEPVLNDLGAVESRIGVALESTEQRRMAEELETFFAISSDSIAILDNSGVVVRANPANHLALGYSADELVGKSMIDLVHPDDVPSATEELSRLTQGGVTISYEVRMLGKDGCIHWYLWNAMPIGTAGNIYFSGKDITTRKDFESTLASREEQLRLFVEHAPASVAMFDENMRYLVASRRWYADFNLPHDSIVGMHHYDVFTEMPERWKEVHRRCLAGCSESCESDEFIRADGKTDWIKWEIRPWHCGDDSIGGIMMFCEVITAQVMARRELERSRNLAHSILNTSLDAVISIDSDGIVTDWNKRAEEIFGYRTEEASGEFLHNMIVPPALRDAHVRGLARFKDTGHGHILNKRVRLDACRKDGTLLPVEVSIAPFQVADETRFAAFVRDITEQAKREQELKHSRESLAEAQRLAGLGSWEWYPHEDRIVYSLEKRRIAGLPDECSQLDTGTFLASVHPDDRERVMSAMAVALKNRVVEPIEYRLVRPDGVFVHVRTQGKVETDECGETRRFFGTTWDITSHAEAAEKVRASEERLALALEGSSDGFWDWNVETGECYFSPRILEWLELDPKSFRHHHKSWEEVVHPVDRNRFFIAFQEHVAHRSSHYEIEERVRSATGRWLWILSRGKVVEWDADGRPLRAAGTWSNITAHKLAEERAIRLGRVVEQSRSEVYMISPQTLGLVEVNQSASENLGYSLSELQEKCLPQILADDKSFDPEALRPLFSGHMPWVDQRLALRRKNGSSYPMVCKIELLSSSDDQLLLCVGVDATEEEYAREEKERLEALLRQSQRMETIGTLAGGIAHDFNNILTPILGYADMARLDLQENSNSRADIEKVIDAARRAKGLVQQILAFCRESDQPTQVLPLDELVTETLDLLRSVLPAHIEMSLDLEQGLSVRSDPSQMHQIVMNLFTNAVHAIGERPGEIRVTVRRSAAPAPHDIEGEESSPSNWVCLCVEDNGCGMSEETMKRIFEPFYTTKEVGQGTGLGLSVVHGLVKSHGGDIRVESELGRGTIVRVMIPASEEPLTPEGDCDTIRILGQERILFCDEDEGIAKLGKQMLENFGYSVQEHVTPTTALSEFETFADHLKLVVISDTFSKAKLDLLAAIRQLRPNFPSVLLASGQVSDDESAKHQLVMHKPVTAAELARGVRHALNLTYSDEEHSVSHTRN